MQLWELYSYFYSLSLRNLFPYRALLEDLTRALEVRTGEAVLDAGCGPGLAIEKIIAQNTGRQIAVTGIDLDTRMLAQARKRCKNLSNVQLQLADLNKGLEFPDNSFDKVLSSNVLYALDNPHKTIIEFHRILKPGGAVVIANPKPNARQDALIRGHIAAINRLTPRHKKVYHIVKSALLIPIYLFLMAVNKVILGRGRTGRYHFLNEGDFRTVLQQAGFTHIRIRSCYHDQDWLITAQK